MTWVPISVVRDAVLIALACAAVALVVNATRPRGLPLIQRTPYAILVPCPEASGEVEPLEASDPRLADALVLDARSSSEYRSWHWPGATHLPFDYLEAVAPAEVEKLAACGAKRLVVYGDGGDPDSGRELARELAGKGLRNVFFVRGGAASLRAAAPN